MFTRHAARGAHRRKVLTALTALGAALAAMAAGLTTSLVRADGAAGKATWDPVITYLESLPAAVRWNAPGPQNLALGKSARAKALHCGYRPFDAVDGSPDTSFVLGPDDPFTSGDNWLKVDLEKAYKFDLPDGTFTVRLYFAEPELSAAGKRKFDVKLSGLGVIEKPLDIWQEAGGKNRGVEKVLKGVKVTGGRMEVEFAALKGSAGPIVSAVILERE
jgi:hypothetical protein